MGIKFYRTSVYPQLYPRNGVDVGRIELNSVELKLWESVDFRGLYKQKQTSVDVC